MNNFSNLAKMIDHTILKANATESDIEKLCQEAKQYEFASVCVNPYWVSFASNLLKDTTVKVCTVIGFPNGYNTTACKVFETADAVKNGANAGTILKTISPILGGGGGGRPDSATSGIKLADKIDEALNTVYEILNKEG